MPRFLRKKQVCGQIYLTHLLHINKTVAGSFTSASQLPVWSYGSRPADYQSPFGCIPFSGPRPPASPWGGPIGARASRHSQRLFLPVPASPFREEHTQAVREPRPLRARAGWTRWHGRKPPANWSGPHGSGRSDSGYRRLWDTLLPEPRESPQPPVSRTGSWEH